MESSVRGVGFGLEDWALRGICGSCEKSLRSLPFR